MAKKKKEKNKEDVSFDFGEYIDNHIEKPKAFLYYIIVNNIVLKDEKEVENVYKKYKELGGN